MSGRSRWLYTQFISVDANFKLKRKANGAQDIALAPGYAYFVPTSDYLAIISDPKHAREIEVRLIPFILLFHWIILRGTHVVDRRLQ